MIHLLIEAGGVDKEAQSGEGLPPLHIAAKAGQTRIVKHLLEEGASQDGIARDGSTALYAAASQGHAKAVKCESLIFLLAYSVSYDMALRCDVSAFIYLYK